jgi:hypothetical protein
VNFCLQFWQTDLTAKNNRVSGLLRIPARISMTTPIQLDQRAQLMRVCMGCHAAQLVGVNGMVQGAHIVSGFV